CEAADHSPHHVPGVVIQKGRVLVGLLESISRRDFKQTLLAASDGSQLRGEIALALLRYPDVSRYQPHHVLIQRTPDEQVNRWNSQAFLIYLVGASHRTRCCAADIRMMCAIGNIEERCCRGSR